MFDVLGFKGIWKRYDAKDVLARMSEIASHVEQEQAEAQQRADCHKNWKVSVRVSCLSDTVVCTAIVDIPGWTPFTPVSSRSSDENSALEIARLLQWAIAGSFGVRTCARIASRITGAAAGHCPGFAYRGAISVGEFLVSDTNNFFVGPAIDECADFHQKANGAMIFGTGSTLRLWRLLITGTAWLRKLAVLHDMPTTSFDSLTIVPELIPFVVPGVDSNTLVVNPLCHWQKEDWPEISNLILGTFEGDERVQQKKVNTLKFLEKASSSISSTEFEGSLTLLHNLDEFISSSKLR